MEWVLAVREVINYVESHILEEISIDKLSKLVYISPFYLQKGFSITTGYSISEYIKSRRLSLAAEDLVNTDASILDIAIKYGYESQDSFTKAFTRFHTATPKEIRLRKKSYTEFRPLRIKLSVVGGRDMDYQVVKKFPFKLIGFEKKFTSVTAYKEIPEFWDEICAKYCTNIYAGNAPANDYEQAIMDNCIGEFGVCIDDCGEGEFRYLVAGRYCGGKVPEGMVLIEVPAGEWAIFNCIGKVPDALQKVNTFVFKEWLPNNKEYELEGNLNIEWYDCTNGEKTDDDYHSAIWIPVKRK